MSVVDDTPTDDVVSDPVCVGYHESADGSLVFTLRNYTQVPAHDLCEATRRRFRAQASLNLWNAVERRLPAPGVDVLCYTDGQAVTQGRVTGGGGWALESDDTHSVLFWRHMPPPPIHAMVREARAEHAAGETLAC